MAEVELPIGPQKLVTFVFDCEREVKHTPLTIDITGLLLRCEGRTFLAAIAPRPDENPWTFDFDIDYDAFEREIWPRLAHRISAFEAIKMQSAWAGYLDHNHFDHNAILGPHPEIGGLIFANGFSGHGVMHSPATGRAISELIAFGQHRSLDLSLFGYERLMHHKPSQEAYVLGGSKVDPRPVTA